MNGTTPADTVFPPPQLLPRRLDWAGQEHPGTYDNLVRVLYKGGKSFYTAK